MFLSARFCAALFLISGLSNIVASKSEATATSKTPGIEVASMEIPFAYESNGTGVYNDIFNKLTEGYSGKLNVSFYPSARHTRVMTTRSADCNYIATDILDTWEAHGISADEFEFIGPVNTLYVVLYIPVDAPDVTTIEQIQKLVVASDVNLLSVIHNLGIKEKLALHSQTQMLNLLAVKRITGLIGYDFDLDLLSKKLGITDRVKKASIRIRSINDGIVCFKNEHTKPFRTLLKENFNKMKASGWLKEAFNNY